MGSIQYIGIANARTISVSDWEKAEVKGQAEVTWDANNGFSVETDQLSRAARDAIRSDPYLLDPDAGPVSSAEEIVVDLDAAADYEDAAKANSTVDEGPGNVKQGPTAPDVK